MKSVQVIVRGRVQGVGFRWFTRDAARTHSVTGWVRNRLDGAVEALLQGENAEVDAAIAALRVGPAHARVEDLVVSDAEGPRLNDFQIRR